MNGLRRQKHPLSMVGRAANVRRSVAIRDTRKPGGERCTLLRASNRKQPSKTYVWHLNQTSQESLNIDFVLEEAISRKWKYHVTSGKS